MKKWIKKLIPGFLIVTPVVLATSCSFLSNSIHKKYEFSTEKQLKINGQFYKSHSVTFKNAIKDQFKLIDENKLNIFDVNDVQYINLIDFIKNLNGLIHADAYINNIDKTNEQWIFWPFGKRTDSPYVKFNFKESYIEFNYNSAFSAALAGSDSGTDYNKNAQLVETGFIKKESKITKIELKKYGFDLFKYKNQIYAPFDVLNLLFGSNNYYNLYLGQDILVGNFFPNRLEPQSTPAALLGFKNRYAEENKTTRNINLNFMALAFDYYYGFKELKMPNGFKEYTKDSYDNLINPSPFVYLTEYNKIFTKGLNDPHSQIWTTLDRRGKPQRNFFELTQEERKINKSYNISTYYQVLNDERIKAIQNDINSPYAQTHYVVTFDETAIIKIDDFVVASNEQIEKNKDAAYEFDTFYRTLKKLNELKKNKKIKNVVFDLSTNTGGHVIQAIKLLGLMTNSNIKEQQFDSSTKNLSFNSYSIDANDDGNYKDDDAFTQYNWFILTSPVTFSAANFMATYAKDNKIAKIIGNKSSGGTFSVLPVILPDGTTLGISSNSGFTFKNGEFVENGAEVDIHLEYSDYFNPEAINRIIKNNKEEE